MGIFRLHEMNKWAKHSQFIDNMLLANDPGNSDKDRNNARNVGKQ